MENLDGVYMVANGIKLHDLPNITLGPSKRGGSNLELMTVTMNQIAIGS